VAEQREIGREGAGAEHPTIALGVPGLAEQDVVADGVVHQPGLVAQMGNPAVATDAAGKPLSKPATRCSRQLLPAPVAPVIPTSSPVRWRGWLLEHRFLLVQGTDAFQVEGPRRQGGIIESRCCSGLFRTRTAG
jgi:hypothetical protein